MKESITRRIARVEDFVKTVDDANALPRAACEMLHALVLAKGVKHAVEVGTSYGYSGLWLAAALAENHGKLITIDHDRVKVQAARNNFEQAGLADAVEIIQDDAGKALPRLHRPIEFVLLDADKENCINYVEQLHDLIVERAIIVVDNTSTHADELAEFVAWIRHSADYFSCHLPVGNGLEFAVRWPSSKKSHGIFGV